MTTNTNDVFRVRIKNVQIKPDWKPKITMHAVLRYLERVMGVDTDAAVAAMQTDAVRKAIVFGASTVKIAPSVKVIIEGNKVVTVLNGKMKPKSADIIKSKRAERIAQEVSA